MLVLLALRDDPGISSEGFMLELFGEFVELVLLPFYVDFRVVEEEYLGEDCILQPDTPHPLVIISLPDG